MSARHRQREHHAALARPLAHALLRILVRVDDDARGGLGGLVRAGGVGRADVDPHAHRAREIAHGERRLVRLGEPLRERDPVRVFEAVREHAREEVLAALQLATKPAGFAYPPISFASSAAKRIGVRSSRYGPIACSPIGRPSRERPAGNAVAGWPATVDTAGYTRPSMYGTLAPPTSNVS